MRRELEARVVRLERREKNMSRALLASLVLLCLVGFRVPAQVARVEAREFAVVDRQGIVKVRLSPEGIRLLGPDGEIEASFAITPSGNGMAPGLAFYFQGADQRTGISRLNLIRGPTGGVQLLLNGGGENGSIRLRVSEAGEPDIVVTASDGRVLWRIPE